MLRNKKAFSLIELLAAVLIIGILAAIAVPQYQKIVMRSKAAQRIAILRSVVDAQKRYFLVNGKYANSFGEIDIKMDNAGKPESAAIGMVNSTDAVRKFDGFEVVLNNNAPYSHVHVLIMNYDGPAWMTGFTYPLIDDYYKTAPKDQISCVENVSYEGGAGDYCEKIMGYTYKAYNAGEMRLYAQ